MLCSLDWIGLETVPVLVPYDICIDLSLVVVIVLVFVFVFVFLFRRFLSCRGVVCLVVACRVNFFVPFSTGPVARWMAVKASAGDKITDNVGPLEVTAGGDALACYQSFKTVRSIKATIAGAARHIEMIRRVSWRGS